MYHAIIYKIHFLFENITRISKHDNNFMNEKMEHDTSVKITAKLIVANIRLLQKMLAFFLINSTNIFIETQWIKLYLFRDIYMNCLNIFGINAII